MNVHDMTRTWLIANHFDGLANAEWECGCGLDDFAPCGEGPFPECQSARAHHLQCGEYHNDLGSGDIWYIASETPNPPLIGEPR